MIRLQSKLVRALNIIATPKFIVPVVAAITLACIAGFTIPQGIHAVVYRHHHPEAAGALELATRLGLTHLFTTLWFWALLGLLGLSMIGCARRSAEVFRQSRGLTQQRAMGVVLASTSVMLLLAGTLIHAAWSQRDYSIYCPVLSKRTAPSQAVPIMVRVLDLIASRSKFDAHPAQDYQSSLQFVDAAGQSRTETIEITAVHEPRLVKDPGMPIMYAGGAFLLVGLALLVRFNKSEAKREVAIA